MKTIKEINLEDSFMNPADFRFFCYSNNSNGTADLIIVDQDNQIIASLDQFLFNPINDPDRNGALIGEMSICYYGESVGTIYPESYTITEDCPEVFPLLWTDVLNSIAESPAHSSFSQLKLLISTIKEAV